MKFMSILYECKLEISAFNIMWIEILFVNNELALYFKHKS